MGIHLVAFAGARVFLHVFQVLAPLLWPLNLWLPLARRVPEACAVLCDALAAHVDWLRRTYARRGDNDHDVQRHALLDVVY
ncbi:unnamed protein product [Alopecurus aequalis]